MKKASVPNAPAGQRGAPSLAGLRGSWPRLRPWLIIGLALILGGFVVSSLHAVLREVSYDDILAAVARTSASDLLLAVLATACSYAALAGNDFSGLHYAKAKVRPQTVCLTSFIAYALGNSIGLGVLTAGGVRLRLYSAAGVEASKVAQAVAFNAAAFGIGMLAFGALGMLWAAPDVAAFARVPASILRGFSAALLLGVAAFVLLCARRRNVSLLRRWSLPLPSARLASLQLLLTAADLAAAATALWFLLPDGAATLVEFMAFYAIAMALGVISHVPGGLGVFEAVILIACGTRADTSQVAAALVLYRGVYFLLPLALAAVLLASIELRATRLAAPIGRTARRLSPAVLASCTAGVGIMLLVTGVTPASETAVEMLAAHMPLAIVEASHLIGSIAGFVLLLLARGLLHRLAAAWWGALLLTVLAAVVALPKGMELPELVLLIGLVVLMLITRRQFDRPSSLFAQTFEPGWLIAMGTVLVACLCLMFFVYRDVDYADQLWWEFAFDAHAPRALRALMAVAITGLGLGLWQLLRRPTGQVLAPTPSELALAADIIQRQPAADACLALMGDKTLLFSPSNEAFIMFSKQGRSWLALSDPVGNPAEWAELIWSFIEMAKAHGGRAVFYKARPQTLPLYLDAGLRAWKLGEEAYVRLVGFSLEGPGRAKLRHGMNRAEREGLHLQIVPAHDVAALLPELRRISDAWLAGHQTQEKGFSLGAFDDAYVQRQPVAIVRKRDDTQPGEGPIVAFATLMCPEVRHVEVSVDLMRHLPDAPASTMDFLFVSLMLHFQAQGYQHFGLGMAPMSGMAQHNLAPPWHRAARMLFEHGGRFYNFRGLRSFKDKFNPVWEARYLVCDGGLAPLFGMADAATLIGGGIKGVIAK